MTKRSLMDSLRGFFAGDPDEEPVSGPRPTPAPPIPGDPLGGDWKERIPQSSLKRVLAIREAVRELEQETATRGMQAELDELGRIKATHLPKLIQSYIEIPEQHRSDVFRETGKSARFLLNDR